MSSAERASLASIHALASEATQRAAECRAWVISDDFNGDSEYVLPARARFQLQPPFKCNARSGGFH